VRRCPATGRLVISEQRKRNNRIHGLGNVARTANELKCDVLPAHILKSARFKHRLELRLPKLPELAEQLHRRLAWWASNESGRGFGMANDEVSLNINKP
jgi:hypothetical protein